MKNMKKVLFLMLLFAVLGTASVSAQVRIGGDEAPNAAAVLDLNATDAINNGTKGLALPRVNFSSNTAQITSGVANLTGMLVYNTNTTLGVGVYYWDSVKWVKISDGSFVEVDGIVGNEVTNATAGGGLVRSGSGTAVDPYTLGINTGGVSSDMISAASVTAAKIANNSVSLQNLNISFYSIPIDDIGTTAGATTRISYPAGCSVTNSLLMAWGRGHGYCSTYTSQEILVTRLSAGTQGISCYVWCFK